MSAKTVSHRDTSRLGIVTESQELELRRGMRWALTSSAYG